MSDPWITESECAKRLSVSEELVHELVSIGAVRYQVGPDFRPSVIESNVAEILYLRATFILRTNRILDDPWGE